MRPLYVYPRIHSNRLLSSSGVAGGTSPSPSARRNHPTMKHSITALTMLLIQQCPAKAPRARPLWSPLTLSLFSVRFNWLELESISYRCCIRPASVTSVCTRLSAWLPTLVFRRAVKTVKTTARPIRHSAMFTTGRALGAPNMIVGQS